ncbi:MAG: B12-binding domain-containing radical SAM protein, partial [Thermodesulfobacteriota bacterium]
MTRILLADIPLEKEVKFGSFLAKVGSKSAPLNIISLGTILQKEGHEIEFTFEDDSDNFICSKLLTFRPAIVGVTCMTMSYKYLSRFIKIIRSVLPDVHIIVGGVHPSTFPEDTMKENPELLAAFIGEADKNLPAFVSLLSNGPFDYNALNRIPNIIFRKPDGTLQITPRDSFIENLDELPFPNFNLIEKYFTRFYPAFSRHYLPWPTA